MGGITSKNCTTNLNHPDLLNVVTLSDSAVQRLPIVASDGPLQKEKRAQNTDDYWRDRLNCTDKVFMESQAITEREFTRLENIIKNTSQGSGKVVCQRIVEDLTTCLLAYTREPMKCFNLVRKLELCLDTRMAEISQKQFKDQIRKSQKKFC